MKGFATFIPFIAEPERVDKRVDVDVIRYKDAGSTPAYSTNFYMLWMLISGTYL